MPRCPSRTTVVAISAVLAVGTGLCAAGALAEGTPRPAGVDTEQTIVLREGIDLAGVPVSGLSVKEFRQLVGETAIRVTRIPVKVTCGRKSETYRAYKLGLSVDPAPAVDAAVAASRRDSGWFSAVTRFFSRPAPLHLTFSSSFDDKDALRSIDRFARRVGDSPRNARLTKVNGKFVRTAGSSGTEPDLELLASSLPEVVMDPARVAEALRSVQSQERRESWSDRTTAAELVLPLRPRPPRVKDDDLKEITTRLTGFSTGLGSSSRNRIHNIRLACKAIDGTVLLPGDVFSYNAVVGPRVESAGFKEAPVIVNGELEPGTGGGICQVSTTLYNAALLADLEIVRRSHHAIPVHYVRPGRDATVVDGYIDFRFRNRLNYPIAIDCKVIGHRVTLNLYGHPEDKREVEIESSDVTVIPAGVKTSLDPSLPSGKRVVVKRAAVGRKVTIRRTVRQSDKLIRTEVVSNDTYRPVSGVIRIGSGRRPDPAQDAAAVMDAPKTTRPAGGSGSPERTSADGPGKPTSGSATSPGTNPR